MSVASGRRGPAAGCAERPGVRNATKPDAPLTSEDIEGLPLTDKVWDET